MIQALEYHPEAAHGDTAIGSCELLGRLAEGDTANVYSAHDRHAAKVAVKVLSPEAARDPLALRRFYAQAKVAMLFQHPHLIEVRRVGEEQGRHFQVMELVEGGSLATHLEKHGRLPEPAVLRLAIGLAEVLDMLHLAGFVHRDVSTTNVLLTRDFQPVLTDLGLALDRSYRRDLLGGWTDRVHPEHLAPEQLELPGMAGPTADVYSLGVLLFAALAGRSPFPELPPDELLNVKNAGRLASLGDIWTRISPATTMLVERCLSPDPGDRPATAWEFAHEAAAALNRPLADMWRGIPRPTEGSLRSDGSLRWYIWLRQSSGHMRLCKGTFEQVTRLILRGQVDAQVIAAPSLGQPFEPLGQLSAFSYLFQPR